MTATDELRRMLDERGVEWGNVRDDGSESDYLTEWEFEGIRGKAIAIERAVGRGLSVEIHRYRLTPEQAVAATLGRGTCKVVSKPCDMWECECGKAWWHGGAPNYCPNCGREVVDTCCVESFDDGVDEGIDGEWYRYAPPTWTFSCGHTAEGDEVPSYCPTCGAKVVDG